MIVSWQIAEVEGRLRIQVVVRLQFCHQPPLPYHQPQKFQICLARHKLGQSSNMKGSTGHPEFRSRIFSKAVKVCMNKQACLKSGFIYFNQGFCFAAVRTFLSRQFLCDVLYIRCSCGISPSQSYQCQSFPNRIAKW